MIHLRASVRAYLCPTPCDRRKSFDSLRALIRDHLELDVLAGHLFVFTSRRRDQARGDGRDAGVSEVIRQQAFPENIWKPATGFHSREVIGAPKPHLRSCKDCRWTCSS